MTAALLGIAAVVALALYWRSNKQGNDKPQAGQDPPMFPDESTFDGAPGGILPDAQDPNQVIAEMEQAALVSNAVDATRTPPPPSIQASPAGVSPVAEERIEAANTTAANDAAAPVEKRSVSLLTVLTDQFQITKNDEDGAERPKRNVGTAWNPLDLFASGEIDQPEPPGSATPGVAPEA